MKIGFRFALNGIALCLKELNYKIHCLIGITIISLGLYYNLPNEAWIQIIICISLVLSLEGVNTAIELTCDLITVEENSDIKKIKDISAGAVLVSAIGSGIIGAKIFGPYLF